jgi:hypothetical protein
MVSVHSEAIPKPNFTSEHLKDFKQIFDNF